MKDFIRAIGVGSLALVLLWSTPTRAQNPSEQSPNRHGRLNVAVLSPDEGPLRDIGRVHDTSIKQALELEEEQLTVQVGDRTLNFLFRGTGNPLRDTTRCESEARRLVEQEQVIAILGPVSSNCTRRVLSENLKVPVISSLSTAEDLGDDHPWFFRTIAHDRRRLETFVDTVHSHDVEIDNSIAIYESSVYGRGLLNHVQDLVPGVDSAHTFRWNEVLNEQPHEVTATDSFRTAMQSHHAIANVFILGSSDRMISVLQALDDVFGTLEGTTHFSLVGSTRYTSELPTGTWLIGEARVRTSRNLSTDLTRKNLQDNLQISTLDAAIALKEAARNVVTDSASPVMAPSTFRTTLRRELERNRFRSSERTRLVEFVNGEVRYPPNTPIYRISRERQIDNLNRRRRESWVEVNVVKHPYGHLAGPLVVQLTPQGQDLVGEQVALQVQGVGNEPRTVERVQLKAHGTRVRFAPSFFRGSFFPSSFSVRTSKTPAAEWERVKLGWPIPYLLALAVALVGAVLYRRYTQSREADENSDDSENREAASAGLWWYVERGVAGVVIAFLVIHLAPLLESGPLASIPIPQFGTSWWVNAFASGLLGGWLGLNPVIGFAATLIGTLTPLFES